jgi:predicted nucleic acid-binding protein
VSRVYWDTMLFIYWLEDHASFAKKIRQVYERMDQRGDVICTSVFTLGELLAGPKKQKAIAAAEQVRDFFHSTVAEVLPFTVDTAERYADIRANQRVTPADAIHLACASHRGIDLFLTNDHRFKGMVIPGIQFTAGLDVDIL